MQFLAVAVASPYTLLTSITKVNYLTGKMPLHIVVHLFPILQNNYLCYQRLKKQGYVLSLVGMHNNQHRRAN